MYDSKELLQDFIIEAKEHLESIEPNIFRLEKEVENKASILNEIFRPMHSLKGASGFLGLEKINTLAHKAESVMDELRKGVIEIDAEITDAILTTTDILGKMIHTLEENSTEGNIEIEAILSDLQRILDNGGGVKKEHGTSPTVHKESPVQVPQEKMSTPMQQLKEYTEDVSSTILHFLEMPNNEHVQELLEDLRTIESYSKEHSLEDIYSSTKNTIEIIEQTQKKGIDFAPMLSILEQELAIIVDLSKEVYNTKSAEKHIPTTEISTETKDSYIDVLENALANFTANPDLSDTAESFYSILEITQQFAKEHDLADIEQMAKNTAEIIKKTQESGTNFSPLLPIISQEISILISLLEASDICENKENNTISDIQEYNAESKGGSVNNTTENTTQEKEIVEPVSSIQQEAKGQEAKSTSAVPSKTSETKAKESEKMKQNSFIRVDHHKLDQLMNLIGELIITRNRYSLLVRSLEDADKDIATIAQNFTETTSSMARISDALQDTIMQVRMVSLSATFSRLPRLVRDISKKSGKEVELHISGEETELDKNMVEALADPLLHLIRNAVDHGVENPKERLEAGKNPVGNVWIRAFHKGNSVVIEIQDDGKGMDPERLKEIAIEKGLLTPDEAKFMSNDQAFELIFLPSFSSAKEVTDISGRGVGMDVVRTNIKNLKGNISIDSVLGKGSTFTLSFPLTLAIIEALMVEVNAQIFAIPLDTVSETTKISKTHIKRVQDTEAITLRGEVLSIVHLADKLGFSKEYVLPDIISVVIVTVNNKKVGLVVDKLLERQEIVIKSLGNYPIASTGISGATITGDGGVILIINPHELCTAPSRAK